jgi:TetR/AcrR family transcriptional regulator, cholesterol catabolism regulator
MTQLVTPKGRKRIGRPPLVENRREMILETASRLFGKVGFEKCSMQDISDSAKVSKGTLYHYFQTKQEIYDAIFLNTLRRMIVAATAAVDTRVPFRTQLVQYFRAHAEYFDSHYWDFNATTLGVAGVSSATMREEAIELRDRYETILRDIMSGGMEAREFRKGDPRMVTRAALSLLNWMPRWYRPNGAMSAGDIAAGLAELLLDGIASPQRRRRAR